MTPADQSRTRYPGAHSFADTRLDRKLFFGRSRETKDLVDTILAERLVVLYARSGVGKTSLLNAGIKEALREQGFLPVTVRLNDEELGPVKSVFAAISEAANSQGIEYEAVNTHSLWVYFKTLQLWKNDSLLIPVLLFDQFEELFTLQKPDARNQFIDQLSALFRGPGSTEAGFKLEDGSTLSDALPPLKVVIGIREDYLPFLEELASPIPGIMRTRFRLTPLSRDNARAAILQPAAVSDGDLDSPQFVYAGNTADAILDLLAESSSSAIRDANDSVEPFQLQLICHRVEELVTVRLKLSDQPQGALDAPAGVPEVRLEDLGGRKGLQKVVEQFYERQLDEASSDFSRHRIERLMESGLVSRSGRRLSLQEQEIASRFKVPKKKLAELADRRVIRAEPRLGSVFYELSHDMLLEPVTGSRARHARQKRLLGSQGFAVVLVLLLAIGLWDHFEVKGRSNLIAQAQQAIEDANRGENLEHALVSVVDAAGRGLDIPEVDSALSNMLTRTTLTSASLTGAKIVGSAFSPDGRTIAVVTDTGALQLFDHGGHLLFEKKLGGVSAHPVLAFTPDGVGVAVAQGNLLEGYLLSDKDMFPARTLADPISAIAFNTSGDRLFFATQRQLCTVQPPDMAAPQCGDLDAAHQGIEQLVYAPGNPEESHRGIDHSLLERTTGGAVYRWDLKADLPQPAPEPLTLRNQALVGDWVASEDGQSFAAMVGSSLVFWKTGGQPQLISNMASGAHTSHMMALSSSGDLLAVVSHGNEVDVFDTTSSDFTEKVLTEPVGKTVNALAWSRAPNSYKLAMGGDSGISVRDLEGAFGPRVSNKPFVALKASPNTSNSGSQSSHAPAGIKPAEAQMLTDFKERVVALSFFPDGSLLTASGTTDPAAATKLSMWKPDQSLDKTFDRKVNSGNGNIVAIAVSPRGDSFLLADDNTNLELWSSETKTATSIMDVSKNIKTIVWSSGGDSAATVDLNQQASEWRIASGKLTQATSKSNQDPNFDAMIRGTQNTSPERAREMAEIARRRTLDQGQQRIRVAFYAPHEGLSLGYANGSVQVNGREASRIADPVSALDITPDGLLLFGTRGGFMLSRSATDSDASGTTVQSGYKDQPDYFDGPLTHISHSPSSSDYVTLSASNDGKARVFRGSEFTDVALFSVPSNAIDRVAVSSNGSAMHLLGGQREYTATLGALAPFKGDSGKSVAVSPLGDFVILLEEKTLSAYDVDLRHRLWGHDKLAPDCASSAFAIAPNAETVAVGCKSGELMVIAPTDWNFLDPVKAFPADDAVTSMSYSGGGVVAGSASGLLTTWASAGELPRKPWPARGTSDTSPCSDDGDNKCMVTATAISSDGKLVAAGNSQGDLVLWRLESRDGKPTQIPMNPTAANNTNSVVSVFFIPGESRLLAARTDGTLTTYKLDGAVARPLFTTDLKGEIKSVKLSPDGKSLAAVSSKGLVRVWDRDGQIVSEFRKDDAPSDLAFTPNGQSLVLSDINTIDHVLPATPQGWLLAACERLKFSSFDTPTADVPSAQRSSFAKQLASAHSTCTRVLKHDDEPTAGGLEVDANPPAQGLFSRIAAWFHTGAAADSRLLIAARSGDLYGVLQSLHDGAAINTAGANNRTALMLALRSGYSDIAAVLIAKGADLKIRDDLGNTTLHAASGAGLVHAAGWLIDGGVSVDSDDVEGVTPLMLAAWHNDLPMMTFLLDRHASIDAQDRFGRTALFHAVAPVEIDGSMPDVSVDAVGLLIKRGADINTMTRVGFLYGQTPYSAASDYSNMNDVAALLKAMKPFIQDSIEEVQWRVDPRVFPSTLQPLAARLAECSNGTLDPAQKQPLFADIARAAAQPNNPDAGVLLGMAIGLGCGTTANQPAARQAFQRSADQNSGLGEAAYGLALWLGEGGPQLKDEAKTYLQKSVDANNPFGEFIMSIYTPDLKIGEDLDAKAAPFFAPAENSLDVFRKFKPTSEHEIDPSLSEAFNQGDLMAGRNIGSSYFGLREFTASTQAWKNALAAPNKMIAWPSMTSSLASQVLQPLGVNFRFGLGGPPSDEEAAGYFERSTDISASALELAWMYEHGQGVPRSRSKALHLYRLAAAEGSFAANAHLRALNTNP